MRVDLLPTWKDRALQYVELIDVLDKPWAPLRAMWTDPSLRPASAAGTIPMPPPAPRRRRKEPAT